MAVFSKLGDRRHAAWIAEKASEEPWPALSSKTPAHADAAPAEIELRRPGLGYGRSCLSQLPLRAASNYSSAPFHNATL